MIRAEAKQPRTNAPVTPAAGRVPGRVVDGVAARAITLQRTAGNRATEVLLHAATPVSAGTLTLATPVSRDGEDGPPTWTAPDGTECRTRGAAAGKIIWIINGELASLQGHLGEGTMPALDLVLEEGLALFQHYHRTRQEALTASDVDGLDGWIGDAEQAGERALGRVRRPTSELLREMSRAPTIEELPAERAMELHTAFTQGSTDRLGEVRSVIDTIKEYNGEVRDLASHASRALGRVDAARTANRISNAAGRADDYLGKISNITGVARGFASLAELDNESPDEMQGAISRVDAALEGIDAGMTFVRAVPVLGQLWSNYYLPAARRCLSILRHIATQQARNWREFFAAMSRRWRRGRPPRIPMEYVRYFPGGRPVFRFVWNALCDRQSRPSRAVKEYFLTHRELLEAGTGDELETERHGLLWLKTRLTTDLWPYARRNRRHLWAMLYGDLPYPAGVE